MIDYLWPVCTGVQKVLSGKLVQAGILYYLLILWKVYYLVFAQWSTERNNGGSLKKKIGPPKYFPYKIKITILISAVHSLIFKRITIQKIISYIKIFHCFLLPQINFCKSLIYDLIWPFINMNFQIRFENLPAA